MSENSSLKRGRLLPSHSEDENGDIIVKGRVKAIRHCTESCTCDIELDCQGETVYAILNARDVGVDRAWAASHTLTIQSLVQITGTMSDNLGDANLTASNATERPSKRPKLGSGDASKPDSITSTSIESTESHSNGPKLSVSHSTINTPENSVSLAINHIKVVALAQSSLPCLPGGQLSPSKSLSTRLDNRILDQRGAAAGAIFKLFSGMTSLITEFLLSRGFTWLQTPRLRSSHVAGDKEYFHVPYFGRDAWLCQHSQHSLQGAIAMDMERVFDIGPVFRQEEKSEGSGRHLSEFTLLGINMTYESNWTEVIDLLSELLVFVFQNLQERKQYAALLKKVQKNYPSVKPFHLGLDEQGKIPRITFLDAKRILRDELGFQADDNENFTPAEEAALGAHFRKTPSLHCSSLFAITHFPLHMRQFNSVRSESNPALSETWDFIAGGLEVCSGSHRISDYDELCAAMRRGVTGPPMDPESGAWAGWMSMFKAGMPAHAGASFGVNRILQAFLGLDDIREVTMFPRDKTRLAP